MSTIPLVDLQPQHLEIKTEVQSQLREVFDSAAFIGGPHVAAFERDYASFSGVSHCVGVANGTDAVELALRAIGVGHRDEVIIPANTFVATAEAVCRAGALPVLVDVDPDSLLMDPHLIAPAVTSRTRAVIPVHLYGQLAPMEAIAREAGDVPLVEDAAQSQGATRDGIVSGGFGRLGATSFYPGKNLGAAGDAGAVTTNDADLARAVRLLGAHGSGRKYEHETLGFNSRLDSVQAVVLRAKLRRLTTWNTARRSAAALYDSLLSDIPGIRRPSGVGDAGHVWHLYVVRVAARDRVLAELHAAHIGAGLHYPQPVHLTKAFNFLGRGPGSFPVAEQAASELLSLPIYPHITAEQQYRVADVLDRAVST